MLYTNHLPKVGATDDGIWRRLIVIPFKAKIEGTKDIKNYADYLFRHCGGACLKWIIEGAEMIIREKYILNPPQCVISLTIAATELPLIKLLAVNCIKLTVIIALATANMQGALQTFMRHSI